MGQFLDEVAGRFEKKVCSEIVFNFSIRLIMVSFVFSYFFFLSFFFFFLIEHSVAKPIIGNQMLIRLGDRTSLLTSGSELRKHLGGRKRCPSLRTRYNTALKKLKRLRG